MQNHIGDTANVAIFFSPFLSHAQNNVFSHSITKTCPCNKQGFFSLVKFENFIRKNWIFFLFFSAQNIDCGYTLEPPRRGGSNEYPQSMFWSKNKKIGILLQTPVLLYKSVV